LLSQAESWSRAGSARWWSTINAPSCAASQLETVTLTNGEQYVICRAPYRMNPQSYERLRRHTVTDVLEVQQPGLFSQTEMFLHVGCNPSAEVAVSARLLAAAANVSIVSDKPLPPSSVRDVFRSQNPSYPNSVKKSFVIAGYEDEFHSAYVHSQYDTADLISFSSLCNSVHVVAKATSHLLGVALPPSAGAGVCLLRLNQTPPFLLNRRSSVSLLGPIILLIVAANARCC
jgi:hypothetical protein